MTIFAIFFWDVQAFCTLSYFYLPLKFDMVRTIVSHCCFEMVFEHFFLCFLATWTVFLCVVSVSCVSSRFLPNLSLLKVFGCCSFIFFCFDLIGLFAVFSLVLYKFVFKMFGGFTRLDDSGTVVLELGLFVNACAFELYIHVLVSVVLTYHICNESSFSLLDLGIFLSQTKLYTLVYRI